VGDFGDIRQMVSALQDALQEKVSSAEQGEISMLRLRRDMERMKCEIRERESQVAGREVRALVR
jgi:hypothetical protein